MIGQILIDKTKLTPARILVGYVVAGVILGAIGIYKPIAEFVQAFNHKPPFLGCKRKVIFLFHHSDLL